LTQINPSQAHAWTKCRRRIWFDLQTTDTESIALEGFDQLIAQNGLEHERRLLESLREHRQVVEATSIEHTRTLMEASVEVIYQAQLENVSLGVKGYPDFILLNDKGDYQALDAKLSRDANRRDIRIQLGCYQTLLGSDAPGLVFNGNGEWIEVEGAELSNRFLKDMRYLLSANTSPVVRYSHSKCRACPYYDTCRPQFEAQGELSLLYGVSASVANALESQGIDSIALLASASAQAIEPVAYLRSETKREQLVMQAIAYQESRILSLAPLPPLFDVAHRAHWVHFDIEDNPLSRSGDKHVYLWGFCTPEQQFEYVWTDDETQDERGWLEFLAAVDGYAVRFPELKLVHFSAHERTTIKQYAARYSMQDHPTVAWLLGPESPLYDIAVTLKESLVLPVDSYGLKDICKHPKLVNFQWRDEDSGSQWSVVQFNAYLQTQDRFERQRLKADILRYNEDDVRATQALEYWLTELANAQKAAM